MELLSELCEASSANPVLTTACDVTFVERIRKRRAAKFCPAECAMIVIPLWAWPNPLPKRKGYASKILLLDCEP